MVNKDFTALCSKAWALQILVALAQGHDPRISPIAHHLGAGRTALTASIQHLITLGYLRRASGHGHPLRPAFKLTVKGQTVADWATQLDSILTPKDWPIARKSWTLPVLRMANTASRFSEFRSQLKPVTDRALSETLKTLGENNWIERQVDADVMPPRVTYSPLGTGELLVPCLVQSYSF